MSRSLEQVAQSTEYYERSYAFRNPAEFRLADSELRRHNIYGSHAATAVIRSFRLKDVTLDAGGVVLFQDGAEITDTRYLLPDDYKAAPDPSNLIYLSEDFDYVLGYNRGSEGYHHWLIQCLPAIDWGLRYHRTKPVRLVLPKLAPWQEEMVTLLGYAHVARVTVEAGRFYVFPKIDYAEYLNGKPAYSVSTTLYETARRILAHLPVIKGHNPILFVPCSNAYYGGIANEWEVIQLFKQFGAMIVTRDLNADVRINLFRNAEVVVGPFGEGLADVLFCRPGTLLWEWTPRHHQNAVINRLAQVAQIDYWGDIFESGPGVGFPRTWSIDLDLVKRRLSEISERLAHRFSGNHPPSRYAGVRRNGKPLDELTLAFESLGEDCDFGLMQRQAGVEPLGLYRFSGTNLNQLLATLDSEFQGVGDPDRLTVVLAGEAPYREFMVADRSIGGYHTFIAEGQMEENEVRTRQARHLKFLRRKILEDLRAGKKIWVWKEAVPSNPDRILALLKTLQRFGPNRLLWVTMGDETNPPGKVERLGADLIRGYVRPKPDERSNEAFPSRPWFEVCEDAYYIWHPADSDSELGEAESESAVPLSAMDVLQKGSTEATWSAGRRREAPKSGWLARLSSLFFSRR